MKLWEKVAMKAGKVYIIMMAPIVYGANALMDEVEKIKK